MATPPPPTATTGASTPPIQPYPFPREYSFPPFYTIQPNEATRHAQLAKWSAIILGYCSHHQIHKLSLSEAVVERGNNSWSSSSETPEATNGGPKPPRDLFQNARLGRRLSLSSAREIMGYMLREGTATAYDDASERSYLASLGLLSSSTLAAFSSSSGNNNITTANIAGGESNPGQDVYWIWYRPLSEWATQLYAWIEGTGQRGSVLTVWELYAGEGCRGTEFEGMDEEVLRMVLGVLVKRGKAQVFGEGEGVGVKFF